jgi:AsmA protein
VALLLVAAVVGGTLVLDSYALGKARAAAADLSGKWGRKVEVGGLSTRLLPSLGARVTGLRVGAGPGEELPLLELDRVEVRADLWGALLSRGRSVRVRAVEVEGLRVNVVRLADGSTNLERLGRAVAEAGRTPEQAAPGPAPVPPPAAAPAPSGRDLSFLKLDLATLRGGRIAFLDRATPGSKELAIDQIDLTVRDLAAGRPVSVELEAAVLAPRRNLRVELHAGPLPASLQPIPDRLQVKLEPVDLSPLAPFAPREVGFLGGRLQVDLAVALGGLAPGGTGPSTLRGSLAATGLRVEGQQGGAPLDVTLDADVEGDAQAGNVRIGRLDLAVGPAHLSGSGRALGLGTPAPRIEGLQLVSRDLDPARLAASYPPLRRALGDRVEGPIGLTLRGSGTADRPTLELVVDLGPVRLELPGTLRKAAGARMSLTARLHPAAGGGLLELDADLGGVDLRPGGALDKGPGDRLAVSLEAQVAAAEAGKSVVLRRLDLLLPGDELHGQGKAEVAGSGAGRTVRFEASLEGARLDLDRLLLASGEGVGKGAAAPAGPVAAPPDARAFAGLAGQASVKLGLVRVRKADLRNVLARVKVQGDEVTLEEARLDAFGGEVTAAGSKLHLARPDEPMKVVARVRGVEAAEVLAMFSSRKVLRGKADFEMDLAAAARGEVAKSLSGAVGGKLFDGAFLGKDLLAGVAGPLARALPAGLGAKVTEGGSTPLGKELPFAVRIADGAARLEKPLRFAAGQGEVQVDGGAVRLDGTLDLPVTVSLGPDAVAALTGGKVRPAAPVPVSFRLAGPAWSPTLNDLGLAPAVKAIAAQAGSAALGKLVGGGAAGAAVGQAVQDPGAAARQAAEEARKKALEEAQKKLKGLFGK